MLKKDLLQLRKMSMKKILNERTGNHEDKRRNLVNFRRTINLTIMSSVDFEEAGHKLLKIKLEPGQEVCNIIHLHELPFHLVVKELTDNLELRGVCFDNATMHCALCYQVTMIDQRCRCMFSFFKFNYLVLNLCFHYSDLTAERS